MLASGEIDAAIADLAPDPRWRTVIPDAKAVATRWSEKHGGVPINHMVVVKIELLKTYPWLAAELYGLLQQSKTAANLGVGAEPAPYGIEINRPALKAIAYFAFQQRLVSRLYEVDELFHQSTREIYA
jgi:4,5-dihydroxyphthalate decarboxylase